MEINQIRKYMKIWDKIENICFILALIWEVFCAYIFYKISNYASNNFNTLLFITIAIIASFICILISFLIPLLVCHESKFLYNKKFKNKISFIEGDTFHIENKYYIKKYSVFEKDESIKDDIVTLEENYIKSCKYFLKVNDYCSEISENQYHKLSSALKMQVIPLLQLNEDEYKLLASSEMLKSFTLKA